MRFKILLVKTTIASAVLITTAAHAADSTPVADKKKTNAAAATAVKTSPKKISRIKITEKRALDLVMAMPEVKEFFKEVTKSKLAKPTIDLDRKEGNAYVIHVYEVVNDGPDSSHTATKNWYYVNMNTGKITREF